MATGGNSTSTLYTELFSTVDTFVAAHVTNVSEKVISTITPVVTVALTISFVYYAIMIVTGKIEMPLQDFLLRAFRYAAIVGIALTAGTYASSIGNTINTTPDQFASSIFTGTTTNATAGELLDTAMQKGADQGNEAFKQAGLFSKQGIGFAIIGVLIMIATVGITAISAAFLMTAKIALAVLAGIGPLFIAGLLFPSTSKFFDRWVGQVLAWALLIVLVSVVFTLFTDIFANYVGSMKLDGTNDIAADVMGCMAVSLVGVFLLAKLPGTASGLSGGSATTFSIGMPRLGGSSRGGGGTSGGGTGDGGTPPAAPASGGGGRANGYFRGRT